MAESNLIPTRKSLLDRLKKWDDQLSWQEFFDIYWKLIFRTAVGAGLSSEEAEEVVQETIISVSKSIEGFDYRPRSEGGSFKTWLLNLTKWRIQDQFRKRPKEFSLNQGVSDEAGTVDPFEKIPDPDGEHLDELWKREWERNLMEAALNHLKRQVDGKHFQVFHLNVVEGWPPKKVANTLNVSVGQVYLVKHRLTRKLEEIVDQLQGDDGFGLAREK